MLYLYWLQSLSSIESKNPAFFTSFFDKLAGTDTLRKQLLAGVSEADIRKSWAPGLSQFRQMRKKYLLYPDL